MSADGAVNLLAVVLLVLVASMVVAAGAGIIAAVVQFDLFDMGACL